MDRFFCRYLRDTSATWFGSETVLDSRTYECRPNEDRTTVKVTNGPATDYGNSPSGPTPDVVYPVVTPNGDDAATPPGADGTATTGQPGGCCADGSADCWRCWIRDHWQWLLILALGLAAYLTRKK